MIASVWLRKHPKQCYVSFQRFLRRKEWGRMGARTARWRTAVELIFFFKTSEIHDCSVWVVASCIFYACSLWSYFSNLCTCIHLFKTRNCFKTTLWSCCSWLKSYYFLRNLLAMDLVVNVEKKWLLPCFLFTFSCAKPWLYDSLLYKRVDLDSHTLK